MQKGKSCGSTIFHHKWKISFYIQNTQHLLMNISVKIWQFEWFTLCWPYTWYTWLVQGCIWILVVCRLSWWCSFVSIPNVTITTLLLMNWWWWQPSFLDFYLNWFNEFYYKQNIKCWKFLKILSTFTTCLVV